jgi:CubicO group peptidase (beta-lactamase class C family)
VDLETRIDQLAAETSFSGVVRVDRDGEPPFAKAYGFAHRAFEIPNTVETRFGLASGAKGFTALVVMSLVDEGRLSFATTARSLLGDDLPLIDDRVTVEQLLAHRSGIGDYFDEEIERPITEHVLPAPVHELDTIERYLRVLDGYPMKFSPDERFSYCNGGYVVLSLLAERASGRSFFELVEERVCAPAGLRETAFLRSDELPERTALGYFEDQGDRTNVFHLPVRGAGDGGIYSTAADISALWTAIFDGRIVTEASVAEMVRPHSDATAHEARYGLGFWLHASLDVVELHGYDAGVSFRTIHDRNAALTHTVIANTSEGAWALSELLDEALLPAAGTQ